MKNDKAEILTRITRQLMLTSSFSNILGLMDGKMGITLFLFHYSRYTGNTLFEDFAGEILDEIYEEINVGHSKNFDNGLAGIAWGFEYLIRQGFVDADPDEVLHDLDEQILERDVRRIHDISLETGLQGIAHYVIGRCVGRKMGNRLIDGEYIRNLSAALRTQAKEDPEPIRLADMLDRIEQGDLQVDYPWDLPMKIAEDTSYDRAGLLKNLRPNGIRGGHAGIGFNLMFRKEDNHGK